MTRARLELIGNAISRGSGTLAIVSGTLVIAAGLACLVPPFYMFMVFGTQLPLTDDVATAGGPAVSMSLLWLATLHALLVLGMGGAAGLRQHRGFDRELLRSLPLRPSKLLLAELPFGLLDTIPVLGLACFSGLAVGLSRSHANATPIVLLVTGLGVMQVLLMQQLVGVVRRLAARPRGVGIVMGLAALPALSLVALAGAEGAKPALFGVLEWLPTSWGYHGLRAWALGDPSGAAAFLGLSAAFVITLFVLTTWLQFQDLSLDPPLRVARQGAVRLWSFAHPRTGIARLFVAQVLGARYGKLLLILPLFVTGGFVLCAAKVEYVAGGSVLEKLFLEAQRYPLYALVPPLVIFLGGGVWLNQFAWHGRGVKSLLLAPIETADILGGKLLALIWLLIPLSLVACLPLLVLAAPAPAEAADGAAIALFVTTILGTAGHLLSVRFPRRLAESGVGVASAPFTLQLLSTALMLAVAAASIGIYAGLHPLPAWAPAAGFVLLTPVVLLCRRAAIPRLVRAFDDCRENLSETLS